MEKSKCNITLKMHAFEHHMYLMMKGELHVLRSYTTGMRWIWMIYA